VSPSQISTKTTRWLSSPSGWDREFESPFLQQTVNKLSVPLEMTLVEGAVSSLPTGLLLLGRQCLGALDLELDVNVAARRVRVGTDLLMCVPGERRKLRLREALVFDH
jgi:hypothetical protein